MAGDGGDRRAAVWKTLLHKLIVLAASLLVLLALGSFAALAVDAVEVTAPQIPIYASYNPCHPNPFLSAFSADPQACTNEEAVTPNSKRSVLLQIDETSSGSFEATATITTVTTDPLLMMVQKGDYQDASDFVSSVVGYVQAGENTFIWSPPTVTMKSSDTRAVISTTGRPSDEEPAVPTGQLTLTVSSSGTVELTTKSRVLAGVTENQGSVAELTAETSHTLTADKLSGPLQINLQPDVPQPLYGQSGSTGPSWVARTASTAWNTLTGFLGPLVPAAAWIALFLAGRLGAFGTLGKGDVWLRAQRILGAVVVAHVVLAACLQILAIESTLEDSFANSSLPQSLSMSMIDAGLWFPSDYPAITGGLVLLITFAVVTLRWNPHGRESRPSRRFSVAALAVLAGAGATVCYALMAYIDVPRYEGVTTGFPGGSTENVEFPLPALEIPLIAMVALAVVLPACVWIVGGGKTGEPAIRYRADRFVIGGLSLFAAMALIAAGIAAAVAFYRSPMGVDPYALWGLGSLATLTVLGILLVVYVVYVGPIAAPRKQGAEPPARSRRRLVGISALCAAAAVFVAVFVYLIPGPVAIDPYDGSIEDPTRELSGSTVLIVCLVVAATLTLAAMAASRPWRSTSSARGLYWIVPVIAALTIAAPFTLADGYIPVALRWGVLIAAGTCAGVAVVRLLTAAVRPLDSEVRMPRASAVLVAAAVAVPWGELGHGIEVGWWDLETYANRIDEILPLVLLAAFVTALRRLGLVPRRDEPTLGAHRRLGIAAWTIALSGSYSFGGSTDPAATAALAAAAVAAWLLLPGTQVRRASIISSQSQADATAAVRRAVEVGVARRTLPGLAKTMREEVAAGKSDFAEAQVKVGDLEARIVATSPYTPGTRERNPLTDDELAFGFFISPRPWARARWGAAFGAAAGCPWVVLGLAGTSVPLGAPEGYPELAFISAVAPLILRWIGYGLLFGYFFPLLRGRTGLGKSVAFFAAALAPSILSTLAGPHADGSQWHSAALLAIQLLIFALSMGLLADLAVLRRNGFTAGRLTDLHSLWTISAWASSVVVAVATGIATIVLAGLQPFVIGVITPSQPSTPPAAVSNQQANSG
jgi:hypothetical protein